MQAFFLDSVPSTNDLARAMVSDGRIRDRAYIVAREQTAGRGNRGHTWVSPKDAGLYLTIVDRPQVASVESLHAFTRAAGIAAVEALQICAGVTVGIKPINDLYVMGRKLGGILTEAVIEQQQLRALITGIGINLRKAPRALREGSIEPICLEEISPPEAFRLLKYQELASMIVQQVLHWNRIVSEGHTGLLEEHWARWRIDDRAHTNAPDHEKPRNRPA